MVLIKSKTFQDYYGTNPDEYYIKFIHHNVDVSDESKEEYLKISEDFNSLYNLDKDAFLIYFSDVENYIKISSNIDIENMYNAQVKKLHDTIFSGIKDPAILHFISPKKPWIHWKPLNSTLWAKEYFKALKGTPWKDFVKEYKRKGLLILPLRLLYPYGITRKIVRWIFSLTNSPDRQYKLLTILGIKFKFKKDKAVNE